MHAHCGLQQLVCHSSSLSAHVQLCIQQRIHAVIVQRLMIKGVCALTAEERDCNKGHMHI